MVTRVLPVRMGVHVTPSTQFVEQYEHDDFEIRVDFFLIVMRDIRVLMVHVSEHDVGDDEYDIIVNQNYELVKSVLH